jgi:hypothetical protein
MGAHDVTIQQARPASLERFDLMIGTWDWDGRSSDGSFEVKGMTTFEWFHGGHFLIERHEFGSGEAASRGLAVYRWDDESQACVAQYFDSEGNHGTYRLAINGDRMNIDWDRQRFAGQISEDRRLISGTWEQSPDGTSWQYWYDLRMTKASVP